MSSQADFSVWQTVTGNRSDCRELQERTTNLMLMVATPLQGKADSDLIEAGLKANVDRLAE